MKLKRKLKFKTSTIILLFCVVVFIMVWFIISFFNENISPNFMMIVEAKIRKDSQDIITNSFNKDLLDNYDISDILIVNKNNNGQILSVDFNLQTSYDILFELASVIKNSFYSLGNEDGYIIYLPMGIGTKNIYFANLGPKIPVKVNYISTLSTSLKVEVNDYGLNNCLIEIYMNVDLIEEVLIPLSSSKIEHDCNILLSSTLIEGSVPNFYGGTIKESSSEISLPIN